MRQTCTPLLPRFATVQLRLRRGKAGDDHASSTQSGLGMWPAGGKPGARALLRRGVTGTELGMNAATEPIPQADLTAEVWTIIHIAAYFQLRQSAAYDKARSRASPHPLGRGLQPEELDLMATTIRSQEQPAKAARDLALLLVLASTGARHHEVAAVQMCHLDLAKRRVLLVKDEER